MVVVTYVVLELIRHHLLFHVALLFHMPLLMHERNELHLKYRSKTCRSDNNAVIFIRWLLLARSGEGLQRLILRNALPLPYNHFEVQWFYPY